MTSPKTFIASNFFFCELSSVFFSVILPEIYFVVSLENVSEIPSGIPFEGPLDFSFGILRWSF